MTCRILTPQPGIELSPPAVEARSLNHWTPRKVLILILVFPHPSTSQAQPCLTVRSDKINLSFVMRTLRVASPGALVCMAALVAKMVKNLPAMQETRVWSLDWEIPLEKGMAIHFSVLAWRIPQTEEPGGLQSMMSQRVGYDWATKTYTFVPSLWIEGVASGKQLVLSQTAGESVFALWFHCLQPLQGLESRRNPVHPCSALRLFMEQRNLQISPRPHAGVGALFLLWMLWISSAQALSRNMGSRTLLHVSWL